jgi:hypothetical protein
MVSHVHGFETLEQAADAISAYLPHRKRPKNLDGSRRTCGTATAAGSGTGTRHS